MKNGQTLNTKTNGTDLYEIDITPKGSNEQITVYVYARNSLDASNFLILNHLYGEQHSIRYCTSNLLK